VLIFGMISSFRFPLDEAKEKSDLPEAPGDACQLIGEAAKTFPEGPSSIPDAHLPGRDGHRSPCGGDLPNSDGHESAGEADEPFHDGYASRWIAYAVQRDWHKTFRDSNQSSFNPCPPRGDRYQWRDVSHPSPPDLTNRRPIHLRCRMIAVNRATIYPDRRPIGIDRREIH
jgi:hypothetical protein